MSSVAWNFWVGGWALDIWIVTSFYVTSSSCRLMIGQVRMAFRINEGTWLWVNTFSCTFPWECKTCIYIKRRLEFLSGKSSRRSDNLLMADQIRTSMSMESGTDLLNVWTCCRNREVLFIIVFFKTIFIIYLIRIFIFLFKTVFIIYHIYYYLYPVDKNMRT